MKWIYCMTVSFILAVSTIAHAAEKPRITLVGIVCDGETGDLIPLASVRFPDDEIAILTRDDGTFTIVLPSGNHPVIFSRAGYTRLETTVSLGDSIRVIRHFFLERKLYHMENITVKARTDKRRFEKIHNFAGLLAGSDLQRDVSLSLAETMKNQGGMAMRSMGPAPSRPVVRGLGGDRVVIAQNGVATHDLSATAPDHAVTVEPFTLDRIEIVRGPKVLLYSPVAIGGMIDTRKESIPSRIPDAPTGTIGAYAETGRPGGLGAATVTVPFDGNVVYGEATWKRTGNERTPSGILGNTGLVNRTYTIGASHISANGFAGLSVDEFRSEYGIPGGFIGGHPKGVDIDMLRRSVRVSSSWNARRGRLHAIDLDFDRTYYTHVEYESGGRVGAEFLQKNHTAKARFHFDTFAGMDNTILAADYLHRDLKMGGYVFTAPTRSEAFSTALYHEWTMRGCEFQTGIRYDHTRYEPRPQNRFADIGYIGGRSFDMAAASIALLHPFGPRFTGGLSFSRSARAPTIEELYNEGPHLAAYSYETGNPSLGTETGTGIEAFGYWNTPRVTAILTGYINNLGSYITFRNTGEINWQQILPVYQAEAVDARLAGLESTVTFSLSQALSLDLAAQYVRGENRTDGIPLPMMPPFRVTSDLRVDPEGIFSFGIENESVARQTRVDRFERGTAGYSIFRPYLQASVFRGKTIHRAILSVENLFDTEYRNHLSRIKSVMPETGRNVRVSYMMFY